MNEYGDGVSWLRGPIIGKGAFGCVYLATLKNPKSKYSFFPSSMAVKSAEVSISGSIQKEREILGNVKGCPDIIKCFGEETTVGVNGAMVYNLLLEYGSGGTLAGLIKKSNGLPEFEVKVIARSILRGLRHIHGIGYVHCDLKPDNILIVNDAKKNGFRAKIGDFGLAKRAKQGKKRNLEKAYWRGTPMYLSPEAVIESEQESPSDMWALGCIVLEMLTGKPPWVDKRNEEILARIGPGREVPRLPSGLSEEAKGFLKGCFVRTVKFRLTAEMLLSHPFVVGLNDDDEEEESEEEVEDLSETESILLVSESDEEFAFDSCGYWSEDDVENTGNEIEYSVSDENEDVSGSRVEIECGRPTKKVRKVLPESGFPVSFTMQAGYLET
ncbi:hypothetical protein CASFOL_038019 [Castilleja foliolosa]|uniref:Protein kinase domain-containing protein n=1 Tax=Castilleja foliolosa TaxID=1961234 RepID=A0ABD3BJS8_9LAMI